MEYIPFLGFFGRTHSLTEGAARLHFTLMILDPNNFIQANHRRHMYLLQQCKHSMTATFRLLLTFNNRGILLMLEV